MMCQRVQSITILPSLALSTARRAASARVPSQELGGVLTDTREEREGRGRSLDCYSHWIPSMGRHAADGMDEALG